MKCAIVSGFEKGVLHNPHPIPHVLNQRYCMSFRTCVCVSARVMRASRVGLHSTVFARLTNLCMRTRLHSCKYITYTHVRSDCKQQYRVELCFEISILILAISVGSSGDKFLFPSPLRPYVVWLGIIYNMHYKLCTFLAHSRVKAAEPSRFDVISPSSLLKSELQSYHVPMNTSPIPS